MNPLFKNGIFLLIMVMIRNFSVLSIVLTCNSGKSGVTDSIPKELRDPTIVWGSETDQFCTGVLFFTNNSAAIISEKLVVFILTSKTNVVFNYLTAPDNKLQRFELSDGMGTIIVPLRGKKLDGDLPLTLAPRELSRASPWLVAPPGTPCPLLELDINDIYHFDKEGDYNFNVCAAIYKLQPDKKLASRISLPCVTGTVHLNKSQKN